MANFTYVGTIGGVSPETRTFDVASGAAASIASGDPVIIANGYAAAVANGGGVNTGTELFGLAISTSTDTVAAAGTVTVLYSPAGLIVRGIATTPANLDTAALFDKVTIDVSGAVITVDENDTTNGAILIYAYPFTGQTTSGICDVVFPFKII